MPAIKPTTNPADEELSQIERDVRALKIEYEQYFGGGRPRPPVDTQWRVDNLIRRCNERIGEFTFAQRFRLNNITQTYAKYQDMWRKKTSQKETGMKQHHYGAAAKAIEAERARNAARHEPPAAHADRAKQPEAGRRAAFTLAVSDPEREHAKVEVLYRRLIDARTETGEKAGAPSLAEFEAFVRHKTRQLKTKGGHEIEYSVSIESGRVKLKARISA
ncbi:MAG TPA: MXAN_5187 C-terminal domain-containing protein [Candidatus Acidoferrales bacterium]|nr:MXAN_5187 C-terminal domain-containing protein [Candidatus Acidoferrales bacterium]